MKKTFGSVGEPVNWIGERGVKLSEVIVTGRQKVESSELKRVKASWSSGETVLLLMRRKSWVNEGGNEGEFVYCCAIDVPEMPDCMMPGSWT